MSYIFKPLHLILIHSDGSYIIHSPNHNLIEEVLSTEPLHFPYHPVQIKPKVSRENILKM